MKKLLFVSVICILTGILFYSCKSNLSITKRHFNKGFYIDYIKSPEVTSNSEKEENFVQKKTDSITTNSDPILVSNIAETDFPNVSTKSDNESNDKSTEQQIIKNTSEPDQSKQIKHHSKIIKAADFIKNHTILKNQKIGTTNSDGEALSLLWLVILVLLILWLLGLLTEGFGLGGLFHVFLVIALILLILWLLRII